MNEQDIERQIDLMENSENWSIYRDHEKRAIAFRAGVEFANTRAPVASGVDFPLIPGVDMLYFMSTLRRFLEKELTSDEVAEALLTNVKMIDKHLSLPPQPVEPVAGQAVSAVPSRFDLRNSIGGIDTQGDNVAIALASYFERHMDRPKDDPDDGETGWSVWVIEQVNKTLDGIGEAMVAILTSRQEGRDEAT